MSDQFALCIDSIVRNDKNNNLNVHVSILKLG